MGRDPETGCAMMLLFATAVIALVAALLVWRIA